MVHGNRMKYLFVSRGFVSAVEAKALVKDLVLFIGMTPARDHDMDMYPYNGGGGLGYTQFQPLMESYAVMDVYHGTGETEVLISTCMPERLDVGAVIQYLSEQIGHTTGGPLRLEKEEG